ncbi:MAG TPA: dihydrolipoyl dehydrogenase [Alphaproteobacteria bacterium]|jgi:dihydrolipoamide dehydrogenase|nr:dihydrolipoyl dehydrogenase [Alphaproteobacteria bacterium]
MADSTYDLVIVGGGPGGYIGAIRAGQLGLKVACVDKGARLGGTCLNIGCIPSKALLQSSEKFSEARHGLGNHGIKLGAVELDLPAMMARKEKVVDGLTKGIEFLFKKNKVDRVQGTGRITAKGEVTVDGKTKIQTKNIVIATGSDVMPLNGVAVDEKQIVSSTGALSLAKVPATMVVIGGGYIGLEMGSVWSRLGAKVTVVEFLDRIVPGMDGEIGRLLQRVLAKQGLEFKLGTKVTSAKPGPGGVSLTLEPAKGGAAETMSADVVLVSIGRRPYTQGLGLDAVGVVMDNRGFVQIDEHFRTNVPGIYAIGDVVRGPMLAHKAEEEGVAVAEIIAGKAGHVNYETVPGIVYTWPEVATVGKTEEQLKEAGVAYKVGKFPFSANSRARCNDFTEGTVKILADAKTDRVLGGHIIGPEAGTLIHEIVMAMEFGGAAEDIALAFHGHPTLNEAVREAALAVAGRAREM